MAYPTSLLFDKHPGKRPPIEELHLYSQLKHEYGAKNISSILAQAEKAVLKAVADLKKLPEHKDIKRQRPNQLPAIQSLRPKGPRCLWPTLKPALFKERLEGSFLGRLAGCTLGAPVEFWDTNKMERLAKAYGLSYPVTQYWPDVEDRLNLRYGVSKREEYSLPKMNSVPVDDDIVYTLLGLLIVEDFGPDFTTADVGKAWVKYLPLACTAEDVALKNLKNGICAEKAGETENPYCEWIGADIRSDPWAYLAPGWPEKAAELAYRDAFLSHRREGIYGEMFFAAAISAAFALDDPIEALKIGLSEIPKDCAMASSVRWALKTAPRIKNYRQAHDAVKQEFKGMSWVHTINNACLTIFGIALGGRCFTKVISETVAMGFDNDCTAATAGSLVGAIVGKRGIPTHWFKPFNNRVKTYFYGNPVFKIEDIIRRFMNQAERVRTT